MKASEIKTWVAGKWWDITKYLTQRVESSGDDPEKEMIEELRLNKALV